MSATFSTGLKQAQQSYPHLCRVIHKHFNVFNLSDSNNNFIRIDKMVNWDQGNAFYEPYPHKFFFRWDKTFINIIYYHLFSTIFQNIYILAVSKETGYLRCGYYEHTGLKVRTSISSGENALFL